MTQQTPWLTRAQLLSAAVSPEAQAWLTETGSLTARLKMQWPALAIAVLNEGQAQPWSDETLHLTGIHSPSWLREVVLHNSHRPLVYARTVIPAWATDNPWQEVQRLGNRPLGELLFHWPSLERSPLVFACFASPSSRVWARRCVFKRQTASLLLTEFFVGFSF